MSLTKPRQHEPMDEDVDSSSVMSKAQRLAHDGYKSSAEVEGTNVTVYIHLDEGQHRLQSRPVLNMALGQPDNMRMSCLIDAIVDYLNAGGATADVHYVAEALKGLPVLKPEGYELLAIDQSLERELYYGGADGSIIRVHPGLFSEELTTEQLEELRGE